MKKNWIPILLFASLLMLPHSTFTPPHEKKAFPFSILAHASEDSAEFTDTIEEEEDFNFGNDDKTEVLGLSEKGLKKYSKIREKGIIPNIKYPEGVKKIYTISNQSKTTSFNKIILPDTLTTLSNGTSYRLLGFMNIGSINIPEGITVLHPHMFERSTIGQITFPNTLIEISYGAFMNATVKGDLIFPSSVQTVGNQAFFETKVKKLVLPGERTSFRMHVFNGLQAEELYVGGSSFEDMFGYSTWITSFSAIQVGTLTFGNGITEIPDNAFRTRNPNASNRIRIKKLILPTSLKTIGNQVFYQTDVQEVTFAEGLERIGINAFAYSTLKEAILPDSLTDIALGAFSDTPLEKIKLPNNVQYIKSMTFRYPYSKEKAKSVTELMIPQSMKEIENEAFLNHNIQSLHIPKNVEAIDFRAFEDNYALKDLSFDDRKSTLTINGDSFKNTSLRIIEVPDQISIQSPSFSKPFDADYSKSINYGWDTQIYKDNNQTPPSSEYQPKVAVYRVNKDKTGYIVDNDMTNEEKGEQASFVVNPVLVQFRYKNSDIPEDLKNAVISVQSSRDSSKTYEYSLKTLSISDIKLGDKLKVAFKDPKLAERYEFALPDGKGYSSINDLKLIANYRSSASDLIQDVYYGDSTDGYNLPYKQALFTIREKVNNNTDPLINPQTDLPKKPDKEEDNTKIDNDKDKEKIKEEKKEDSNKDNDPKDAFTPIEDVPTETPPKNIPFQPSVITNTDKIPNQIDSPVFQIVDESGTPLGNAIINLDDNTYTFVDDDATPLGIAKISDDNSLDIMEIFEDRVPQGTTLPKTGFESNLLLLLMISGLSVGALIKIGHRKQ